MAEYNSFAAGVRNILSNIILISESDWKSCFHPRDDEVGVFWSSCNSPGPDEFKDGIQEKFGSCSQG